MGIDKHEKARRGEKPIGALFVPMLLPTIDSPAWRALSHGARSLYMALKRRFGINIHNNGKILSCLQRHSDQNH
jgi:hypothetical protein